MLEVSRLWLLVVQELICDGYWIVLMLQILSNVCSPLLFIPATQFSSPFLSSSFFFFFLDFFPETLCWKKDFTVQPWRPYIFMLLFLQQSFHLTLFITPRRVWFGQLAEERKKKMVYYCFLTAARKERFWKHASVRYRKIHGLGYNLHAHLVIITF